MQAAIYEDTLNGIYHEYGYSGALWCAFYSVRMTGAEYDPDDPQPNNPNFLDWCAFTTAPCDVMCRACVHRALNGSTQA